MLVLASTSPRRRELLARLGVAFVVMHVDVDETPPQGSTPEFAACEVAHRKALAAVPRTRLPVLAADTMVIAADGEILGKPRDAADAHRILTKLSGTTHRVITGVVLAAGGGGNAAAASDTTSVTMRPMSEDEIALYVATGEPFGKAGAYAIQESGDRFVSRVVGSWTNVVGLPLELVERMLRGAGIASGPWA